MNTIVYQAYNSIDIIHECLYSLYSLPASNNQYSIIIYTDNEPYFASKAPPELNINYRTLDQQTIDKWKGEHQFVHRFKIMMLIDLLKSEPNIENILYLDTDTKIRTDLSSVFEAVSGGQLYMHLNEGEMYALRKSNPIFRKTINYVNSDGLYTQLIPLYQNMWNAGALAFRSTDIKMLDEVLSITDNVYSEYPKHIVEQLAFSIVMSSQKNRKLESLEAEVFHYWNFKEFRSVLDDFFNKYPLPPDIAMNITSIDPEILIQPKLEYESLPFHKKLIRKVLNTKTS